MTTTDRGAARAAETGGAGAPSASRPPAGLEAALRSLPGRCAGCGAHVATQGHGSACAPIAPDSEFAVFMAALRSAADSSGLIHQTDVRPLIQAIPHKHRGTAYRKALAAGLIELVGKEPSTDAAGKNTDKDQKVYRLRSAA